MTMKLQLRSLIFLACTILLVAAAGMARADEVPLINGDQWTKSSEEMKKAYLVGIANVAQIETAYSGTSPPPDAQSIVPRLVRGLKGQTLDSVRETLNRWYAAHPDQLQRPVIETLWFEMVVPGLQKSS
ncbi:MAG TPA: hypothetical protein VLU54_12580 [Casimicrobiaceae bacterium]|nr:hypothetical protein [Casimicrobiaceae bacterium]